jgi:RNA polymerase sigma factor (sigma-70 family)
MSADDDASLLRAWTERRSEEAFRRLVDRYAGLVFGAARRRTGDEDLAAEAAQDVFVRLAQRAAGIRRPESLPAWLHAAAVHAATDRLRRESRHRERMKRYREHSDLMTPKDETEEQSWRNALPELDEAIRRLSEADRGLVLARYCQGKSVAEAARRLGLSPAAAQKRGERALEKLAGILKRRDVALSAAVLSSGLGAHLTHAAPAGMGGKWCAAALAAGKSGTGGAAVAWTAVMSSKAISIAAVIVAAAIPVGMQFSANAKARAVSPASGSAENNLRFTGPARLVPRARDTGTVARQIVNGLDLSVLAREIRSFPPRRGRLQKELELRAAVLTLDAEQCAVVARWLAEAPGEGSLTEVAFDLFTRWEELDREAALSAGSAMMGQPGQGAVLHAWSEKDPQGMLARFSPDLGKDKVGTLALNACQQALRAWAGEDPRAALQAAAAIAGPQSPKLVDAVLWGWSDAASPDAALEWLETEATPEQQTLHYQPLISYLQDICPDKVWNSLVKWPNRAIAESEACPTLNMWAGHDPDAAVAAWLSGPEEWRNNQFAFNLAHVLVYAHPDAMRKLARELPDPKLRETFARIVADRLDKQETERE